jgi:hypothetical protein
MGSDLLNRAGGGFRRDIELIDRVQRAPEANSCVDAQQLQPGKPLYLLFRHRSVRVGSHGIDHAGYAARKAANAPPMDAGPIVPHAPSMEDVRNEATLDRGKEQDRATRASACPGREAGINW